MSSPIFRVGGSLAVAFSLFPSIGFAQSTPAPAPATAPALSPNSASAPVYSVTVDGKPVAFGDAPPVSQGGRVLVPLRAIFEALGANVSFSQGVISASRGQSSLRLTVGSTQAQIGPLARTLEVPPLLINGKAFVPLRFVGEALGAGVQFDAQTGRIALSSPKTDGADGGFVVPGAETVSGTVLRVENTTPGRIALLVDGQVKTYEIANGALILRQLSVASSLGATPVKQGARPTDLRFLSAGGDVRLTLGESGKVIQILGTATVVLAKVQFASGNQIILEDERDTTLTVGDSLPFTGANGQVTSNVSLPAGSTVALFLSRQNKAVYRVSAAPADIALSNPVGTVQTPDPLAGAAPKNAPQILLVQSNAKTPLRAGEKLEVFARATPLQALVFSVGAKIQNVAMIEDPAEPGSYSGTYTVKSGDSVLDARPTVRLVAPGGFETSKQAETGVTLDTQAPRLLGTFPTNGGGSANAQPNIVIFADDIGGSGLQSAKITLTDAVGTSVEVPATVAPPSQVNAVAPKGLSGLVRLSAQISDAAGNTLPVNFSFTIGAAQATAITGFSHGATRALVPGEEVPLELLASPGGSASFDVRGQNGQLVANGLALVEDGDTPGRYRGSFRVPDATVGTLRFTGKFAPGDGSTSQAEASAPVTVTTASAPTKLTITSHKTGDVATSPLVLRGKAAPGALVEVAITGTGTQFFVFEYREDLGKFAVRANDKGDWQTEPISLPTRKNVGGLGFQISATQTDIANRQSAPTTLSLKAR